MVDIFSPAPAERDSARAFGHWLNVAGQGAKRPAAGDEKECLRWHQMMEQKQHKQRKKSSSSEKSQSDEQLS